MALSDLVVVNVTSTSVNPTRPGFGTPLVAAYHTHYGDRIRYYTGLAGMVSDGFSVHEPAYLAAQAIFSQNPCPPQVAVGRRANAPLQVLNLACQDSTAGDVYNFTLTGSDGTAHALTYTVLSSATTTTVATAIAALITAFSIPGCTVTHNTNTITLTQTAGNLVDIKGYLVAQLQLSDTTADPGLAADLAAIYAADPVGWYGLCLDSNSATEIEAAAAWVEANGKIFAANNSDYANCTSATNDVFSTLKTSAYAKTYVQQCNKQLLSYGGAAMLGNVLPDNPGTDTWAYKTLVGVPADDEVSVTPTMQGYLTAKSGNWYKTVANVNISFPGQAPGSQFMDIARFLDWFRLNLQIDVFALLASLRKVPYTDVGIDMVTNVITNRIKIGGSAAYGGFDLTRGYTVTAPTIAQTLPTDRSSRNLPNVSFTAYLSGAIQTVKNISGTVSV